MLEAQKTIESAAQLAPQSGMWSAIPSIMWAFLAILAAFIFHKDIRTLVQSFTWRLRTGAALKLYSIELGQSYVSRSINTGKRETALKHRTDENEDRWRQRQQYYVPNRNIHLVHRIAPSNEPRMLYDIQLYLVAHEGSTLANLIQAEYYFGRGWNNQIFTSIDRAQGFPIATSAYGAFMCTAKLYFSDGEIVFINRYVDFEMGAIGSHTLTSEEANK
jgi:hypothetical protein